METKAYGSITITDVTDGKQFYTWIMYADDKNGTNMSEDSTGKAYIGHAYNQTEPTPNKEDPSLYEWALFANREVNQTELYYASASDRTPPEISDAAMASGYWKQDFPTTWSSNTYIWTTTKTEWVNGDITYSPDPPRLISQIEAATMSAQVSKISLSEWCALNNVTIIDGSTIATGSIDASKISVSDLNAFNATVGGWRIGENELYSNTSLVGLFAGTDWTAPSLLEDTSPMRFYAGKDVTIEEEEINMEIIVNGAGPWTVSHTFDCDEIEFVRGFWEDAIPDEVEISVDGTTLTLTADYGYFQEVSDFVYVAFVKKTTYGDGAKFMILEDGSLYASAVDLTGNITATEGVFNNVDIQTGTIGGFTIADSQIYTNTKSSFDNIMTPGVYIGADGIRVSGELMVDSNLMGFYPGVSLEVATGKLTANNVDITGKIVTQSGKIGGFTIADSCLYSGKPSMASVQHGIYFGTDGIAMSNTTNNKTYWASMTNNGKLSFYDSESYIEMQGGNIVLETPRSIDEGTYTITTLNGAGLFIDEDGNADCIIGRIMEGDITDAFSFGMETGDNLYFYGYRVSVNAGSDGLSLKSNGAATIQSTSSMTISTTGATGLMSIAAPSMHLGTASKTSGYLNGTWYTGGGLVVSSWRGAKHDIEVLDNRYSELFDNLNPVRFKYDNGQSDRYHTGFILDEMKSAMDAANVDSQEFAAYCVQDETTGEGGIRYEELIALLIKEVQALKREIKEIKENE